MALDLALKLIEWRVKGLEIHLKRFGTFKMGYSKTGGGLFMFEGEGFEEERVKGNE